MSTGDVPLAEQPEDQVGSAGVVETQRFTFAEPPDEMELECGTRLGPITLAYETYGKLTPEKDNVVLIVHALSSDAHVAGFNSATDTKPGWWDIMVGPGKPFDTNKYFVLCSNIIGGCNGSTGPSTTNPKTGKPYGLDFPMVTVGDMVAAQRKLLDHLGLKKLLSICGGSMGGMQVLEWAVQYPDMVVSAMPIATTARLSAQAIAFNEVGRQAIMADPNWQRGNYYGGTPPRDGLAIARMIGHITYLSDEQMHEKFGRRLQNRQQLGYDFSTDFEVESYLRYQGDSFVKRFDANSYLYLSKAMDYFDLPKKHGSLVQAFERVKAHLLVVSFTSDWLFPTYQSKEIVKALKATGVPTTFLEITKKYGHDAFLLRSDELAQTIRSFLRNIYQQVRRQTVEDGA
ncbi:MAG: homoserine O-acetyltransferase [Planctomycetia bacterium]|nr:homoserine O-acetyltransferase [Planctomycetia bacterium]